MLEPYSKMSCVNFHRTPLKMNKGGPHIINNDQRMKLVSTMESDHSIKQDAEIKVSKELELLDKKSTYSVAQHIKNSSYQSKNK